MRQAVVLRLVPLLVAAVLACSPVLAADSWTQSDLTMGKALAAGFHVVDTYHTGEGHLVFVLQLQARVLLCAFREVQDEACLELTSAPYP